MIGRIINGTSNPNLDRLIAIEDFLNNITVVWGLMEAPSIRLTLPITYAKYINGNSIISLKSDGWSYEGYVEDKRLDFRANIIELTTVHIINKLEKRTLPTNITLKDMSVKDVITHTWGHWKDEQYNDDLVNKFEVSYVDSYAELYRMEYEFSNETIIEFLTKVCEKTPELYWRVSRKNPYQIEVGVFGKYQDVFVSESNLLVSLDGITEDYTDVVNVAVVMSDKSDSGASSLTLRDIFYNPSLMVSGYPVIKTGNVVNSQRHYQYPQIPQFAPEIIGEEFAVIDEEGIALEAGQFYWGTVTENDIQAIAEDNEEITNDDRLNATIQLYQSAIRRLKNSRRKVFYELVVEPIDKPIHVGDKIMFALEHGVTNLTPCSKYYEKVLRENNWFYITEIEDIYEVGNAYTQRVTLSKFIHSERDYTAND